MIRLLSSILLFSPFVTAEFKGEKILFYDDAYSVQYGGVMEPALQYFAAQSFRRLDTVGLKEWIEDGLKRKTCAGTTVLQISDITSKELAEPWDKTSVIYRYCAAGGRWVAPGGNTFYSFEGRNDFTITNQDAYIPDSKKFITSLFGAKRVYGLKGKGRKITVLGKAWGLKDADSVWTRYLTTGMPPESVRPLIVSDDGKVSQLWHANINPKYPHSGLIGMCLYLRDFEPMLEAIYRLCVFDGKPVEAPKVEWRPKQVALDYDIQISSVIGGIPRKAFQRGEIIPVRLQVSGTRYSGEEVRLKIQDGDRILWEQTFPRKRRTGLIANIEVPTSRFRCGDYIVSAEIPDKLEKRATYFVCPARRNSSLPWFVCKMHRKNPRREEVALRYLRKKNLNAMIFDLYQLENADKDKKTAARLGNYLDLLLRLNLSASARPTAINLYANEDVERVVLYDGSALKHGTRAILSWRAFKERHLDKYRNSLRRQTELLRKTRSPVLVPYFTTNDDGSMGGNFDFNERTMAEFTKRTRLERKSLPPLKKMPAGHSVFMPEVEPGVVPDKHPWLEYFRYHCSNYSEISRASMEGIQSGWPGSLVADTGCMAGPLYVPRGFYPPLSIPTLNTASFYQYLFWFHAYPFGIEAARMGNRDKPVGLVISASWIDWGRIFQRGVFYRTLAEAPKFIGLWSMDARREQRWDREEESWDEMASISAKLQPISSFINRQQIIPRHAAMFFGLAQNCFDTSDKHLRPYYIRTALANFQRVGAKLDLIATEEVMNGILPNYDAIFISGHRWMTEGAKKRFEDYVVSGGSVILDSRTSINIKGAVKAKTPFGTGLNDVAESSAFEQCKSLVSRFLKPEIMLAESPNTLIRVNRVGRTPVAWVLDAESHAEIKTLNRMHSEDWDNGTYRSMKEWAGKEPRVEKVIRVKEPYYAYDLYAMKEIPLTENDSGWRTGKLTTEFYGAKPLALYEQQLGALRSITAAHSIKGGESFVAYFELRSKDDALLRGTVPAVVTVQQPNGKEAWEYGGPACIEDGLLAVKIQTAINDLSGAWKVVVKECCTGQKAEASFFKTE
jgi:hypothetical protein